MKPDEAFELFRARVDDGLQCPACMQRPDRVFPHDGEAYRCTGCGHRFSTWLIDPKTRREVA